MSVEISIAVASDDVTDRSEVLVVDRSGDQVILRVQVSVLVRALQWKLPTRTTVWNLPRRKV